MAFMEQQIEHGEWYEVETNHGTEWLPVDVIGDISDESELSDYVEGTEIHSYTRREGYGARLSAPGYMDCTDWCVFDTEQEAQEYLDETYGDDSDEDEE